ncbi:hypothetical protein GCM10022393_00530 [Aquimarina addita]|uniref:HTH araC/xylS-type domain-containing protein n=1 Tax=Aquimarina addita TaxID=870485 RepID=A0ABP7X705_9FLAO
MSFNLKEINKKQTNDVIDKNISSLFIIEKIGYFLILISGVLPFVHSFIKHEVLDERLFGFTSVQSFLYSFGVHISILFLSVGIFFVTYIPSTEDRYKEVQKLLRYTLISPFASAIFYNTWVFIPNIDYNLMAYIFLSIFICVISIFIFFKINKAISISKVTYEGQLNRLRNSINSIKLNFSQNSLPNKIIEDILDKLQNFEISNKFLSSDINLNSLATQLNTNSKYLSKAINQKKNKSFTQYINDLRIEYLIKKLHSDNSYSKYSIKALSEEIGFKTSNAFSRAFLKKMEMYPSHYINQLKK